MVTERHTIFDRLMATVTRMFHRKQSVRTGVKSIACTTADKETQGCSGTSLSGPEIWKGAPLKARINPTGYDPRLNIGAFSVSAHIDQGKT